MRGKSGVIMDFEEMNQRAYRRETTPDGLYGADLIAYQSLALMYSLYFLGAYTREQGQDLKERFKRTWKFQRKQQDDWLRSQTAMKLLRQSEQREVLATIEEVEQMAFE